MSLEQLKAFLEKVKGDTSLQEKLKGAKSPEHVWPSLKIMGMHSASISSRNSAMKNSMVSLLEEFICAARPPITTRTVDPLEGSLV